jgi:hypothetical protein
MDDPGTPIIEAFQPCTPFMPPIPVEDECIGFGGVGLPGLLLLVGIANPPEKVEGYVGREECEEGEGKAEDSLGGRRL